MKYTSGVSSILIYAVSCSVLLSELVVLRCDGANERSRFY